MHKVTFFPLGNADCCLIDLGDGRKVLVDYCHCRNAEDPADQRIDLKKYLKEDLKQAKRKDYDVVAYSHCDDDHIHGSSEFFYLEHADKYQDGDRVKISELWVPAAMILEKGLTGEAAILRSEARYRLKNGKGIRIFSRPEALDDWLKDEGIDPKDRRHLITDAGQLIPGYDDATNAEFFVHSPFAVHTDEEIIDRNQCSLVLHITFYCEDRETRLLLGADETYEVWGDIVSITTKHKNQARLAWDIFKISHHCSYMALNGEKGKTKTTPTPNVNWLLNQGQEKGTMVSPSEPVPDKDTDQPPHFQAANTYKDRRDEIGGEFIVMMEHPTKEKPDKLIFTIDKDGTTRSKAVVGGSVSIVSSKPPRAGK